MKQHEVPQDRACVASHKMTHKNHLLTFVPEEINGEEQTSPAMCQAHEATFNHTKDIMSFRQGNYA